MAENKKYYIRVNCTRVEVTEEVYRECRRSCRREKTLAEKDGRNGLMSYHALDKNGMPGEAAIVDRDAPSVEDMAISACLHEELHRCLALLSPEERALIQALFFEGKTERQYALETGTHRMTIHSRKVKILCQLKKFMKI